jgi:small subunit ribosomal protein S11
MATKQPSKKKKNIKLPVWVLHIHTSFNNTIVTLTDPQGNKIIWWWTGKVWFKWAKQSTPYAAEVLTKELIKEAKDNFWLKEITIIAKWLGMGRDGVFKWVNDTWGIDIASITEKTWIQFGGNKGIRPKRN